MRASLLVVSLIMFSSALSGCTRESSAQIPPPPESRFVVANQGSVTQTGASTDKQAKVLSTPQAYAAALAIYSNDPPATLDFTTGRVLLVDMGARGSSGYSIGVTSVDVGDVSVTANVKLTKPGTNCALTAVVTNPYQFVFVPSVKEILVSESVEVVNC